MECPNAKGYMVYPEDFGVETLNSLTKNTGEFKKANHENWRVETQDISIWSYLELSGAILNYLELSGAIWTYLELSEAI
jgi:hypothetical protein